MEELVYIIDWFLNEGDDDSCKGRMVMPHLHHAELRKILSLAEDDPFEGCVILTPENLQEICRLFDVKVEYNDKYVYFIGDYRRSI